MKLGDALDIKRHRVISLVGGGGKTTIMFALAREIVSSGGCVITTTTTRILIPINEQSPHLILGTGAQTLKEIEKKVAIYNHITLAGRRISDTKLKGVEPGFIDKLSRGSAASHIIVEADGSAGRPLKAPNNTEPVIPSCTSLVIAVMGADALGKPFNEDTVFRAQIASKLISEPLERVITSEIAARLMSHNQGIIKSIPANTKIIYFINKIDLASHHEDTWELARLLLLGGDPRIIRVVLGQAQSNDAVLKIFPA